MNPDLASALATPGRVAIPWVDAACDPARPVTLHCYRPEGFTPDSPVVLIQHGMLRNGDEYRDFWIPAADTHGLLLVAPTFTALHWPQAEHYNNGLVLDGERVRPRDSWAYAIPLRVFAALQAAGVTRRAKVHLFGHSAGGQFVHRLLATQKHDALEAVIAGNPGWYSLPTLEKPFPAGLGDIGVTHAELVRLLAYPLTILAGDQDIETQGPSLPSQPEAIAQGPHRFARARHYLKAGQAEAARRSTVCNWRLVPVAGVGHDGAAMSRVAAALWFENRLITAEEAGAQPSGAL